MAMPLRRRFDLLPVDRSVNVSLRPRGLLYLGDRKRRAKDDREAKDLSGARSPKS
jgi:hypothetical protein